jgi:hypothetical protein
MYYCKGKMYSAVNFNFDDIVVDVVTIREKSKFSLTLFIKKRVVTLGAAYSSLPNHNLTFWLLVSYFLNAFGFISSLFVFLCINLTIQVFF